jgi:hypothetical protein
MEEIFPLASRLLEFSQLVVVGSASESFRWTVSKSSESIW